MRRRFRISPAGKGPFDPWFHIGTLEVTTSMAVVLLSVVSILVFAVEPLDKPIMRALALDPDLVLQGQVWRIVTWPFSNLGFDIWTVLNIFFFWYFGQDIEKNLLGRARFVKMIVWMTLVLGVLLVAINTVLPFGGYLFGLSTLELMVLLAWIAEWPTRRFMFNVPAWLFGLIIVALQVIPLVAYQRWVLLVHFLLGIAFCALIARHYGMLTEHHWVPNLHRPHRQRRQKKQKRSFDPGRPTVVSGPWESSAPVEPRVSKDEARMNALLDKIHASGTDSLTDKERAELLELRDRLRRR